MVAIIPARGGSKGLPRKNIKIFNGKPLIYYTIKSALESKYIDKVIVSTDDQEIAEIALSYGAIIPFLRPINLSEDNSKAIDVYIYTINRLNLEYGLSIKDFIVLLPTTPLRTKDDIDKSIDLYYKMKAKSVISVKEAEYPIEWFKKIDSKGILKDVFQNIDNTLNRQESSQKYIPNGAIYVLNLESLINKYSYYNEKTYPYIMSNLNSIDIDTELDFLFAEIVQSKYMKI
jgi:CMP-N,N'-diacetyllegionaminic acid synthase